MYVVIILRMMIDQHAADERVRLEGYMEICHRDIANGPSLWNGNIKITKDSQGLYGSAFIIQRRSERG